MTQLISGSAKTQIQDFWLSVLWPFHYSRLPAALKERKKEKGWGRKSGEGARRGKGEKQKRKGEKKKIVRKEILENEIDIALILLPLYKSVKKIPMCLKRNI